MAKTQFVKWASLNQFHEVIKNLNYPRIYEALKKNDYKITFGLKIKLHGTNACVRIEPDGKVVGQKRSSDVFVGRDNMGFAVWVADNESYFASLADSVATTYIYGEWCGPGVQNGVACSQTDKKKFYPFAIDYYNEDGFDSRVVDSEVIEHILTKTCPNDIIVIPWFDTITLDFQHQGKLDVAVLNLNKKVEEIGVRDPLLYELFEIDDCGEGVVAYPMNTRTPGVYEADEVDLFAWFNFKAKSEAHRVNKSRHAVKVDPEKFANANRFADAFCTEQRFEQGFTEALQGRKDMKLVPDFLKWVLSDIFKESKTEREESSLDWKALSKTCSTRAVLLYKHRVMETKL
jgi:hypothetical protein